MSSNVVMSSEPKTILLISVVESVAERINDNLSVSKSYETNMIEEMFLRPAW